MTTTIVPGAGQGNLFTQQGAGASPGYAALDVRRGDSQGLQEGVVGTGASAQDFMVQQRLAGANQSVDITMPAGGGAYVQGDAINGQGLYYVPVHSANINEAVAAADPTNPRIDQVVLEIFDNVLDGSGLNISRTRVLTGTPTSGATLNNRTGAAALPNSALLLADILVPALSTSVTNANIRDRRKWARGASSFIRRTDAPSTASTSYVGLDTGTRFECSGVPLTMTIAGRIQNNTAAASTLFRPEVDGAAPADGTEFLIAQSGAFEEPPFVCVWTIVPTAGSHLLRWAFKVISGTATIPGSSDAWMVSVQEQVRQNSINNPVTSG